MKPERWRLVKELLEETLDQKDAERAAFLAKRCAGDAELQREVEALLAADERAGALLEPQRGADVGVLSQGEAVGPYRIVRLIGEGGMGEVYEAEQAKPVRRRVALKLVKLGMDTRQIIARFDAERQALALMGHPNIARVFDAGTTEKGRPYFVMEFVPGVPISRYCDENHLDAVERLKLFIQVCEGVHHAHQKGVIHRDIKPSNVLVTLIDGSPVPKIIDFGLARATAQPLTDATYVTQLGQAVGTPEFMSPEQAGGEGLDVDIRTDVYSLGVLLYELLTGARPFELRGATVGLEELRRKIRETDPAKPSTRVRKLGDTTPQVARNRRTDPSSLVHTLRGDLDWITMKALEKDRGRRYASVSDLAADVERHLKDQPVLAGPSTVSYRIGKFVRRHKLGVAVALLVVLSLVLGATAATVGMVRARRAEAVASQEAEAARQVSDFLVELFTVSDPTEARGDTVTAREILDRGAERIGEQLQDQPLVQARLIDTIGTAHSNLGLLEEAASLHRRALAARSAVLGERNDEVAGTLLRLGFVEVRRGQYEEAERLMRRSLDVRRELHGDDDLRVAYSMVGLAQVLHHRGHLAESQRLYERALEVYEEQQGADHPDTADVLNDFAITCALRGESLRADELFRRALAIGERTQGSDHPSIGLRLTSLGIVQRDLGRYEESEAFLLRALAVLRKSLGDDHRAVANVFYELGALYAVQGRHGEAEPRYERALATLEARLGENHPSVAETLLGMAELHRDRARHAEAEESYQRALAILEAAFRPGHPELRRTRESYAAFLGSLGRDAEAADLESSLESSARAEELDAT